MFTNRARILVIGAFVIMLAVTVNLRVYEVAGVIIMFIGLLIWGYFKEGTVVLAAKAFHNKDYDKAEALLTQVNNPDWLGKKRRGFYEFIYGGICLQKQDYNEAEKHYEIAAQYPLRSANDHVAALVHVANISIRHNNFDKAKAYLALADKHEEKITAKMKEVIRRLHQELDKK
ncbi:lipopolysaccharide assembly protein LapB [Mucilaginibacter sp. UR6-11]|uniref:tetratricopeptide repeat protein n=1 Tax=Mucilaginibacter sp. UR6-11 TaxID=1435644 RepID=UPI001E5AAB0F|nr:tetratricopeptide repeat protein [Mucilaginibacter sp. UR6-11]MCC8424211.1 tetratricopeptide repeat protein [Mucilaginibacter sp. UR6-11]